MKRIAIAIGVVILVLSVAAWAQNTAQPKNGSNVGTWKLNVAKSTFSAGTANKSATFTVAAAGAGFRTTSDSVAADGTVRYAIYSVLYDGKDNPITGNSASGDVVAATRIDDNTVRTIYKKGEKVTITQTSVVSSDGNTMTITATGTNALGQTVNNVTVYDKQPTIPTNNGTWVWKNLVNSNVQTLTIEAAAGGFKHTIDRLNAANGTLQHRETSGNYDGQDCPVIGNDPNVDMVAFTRVDANTTKWINKKGGKVTTTTTSIVSSDRKDMIIMTAGTNPNGQAVNTVVVFNKQTNIGTWKVNLAKSKIPADKAPKSVTFKVEAAGAGIKATVDAVYEDGFERHWALSGKYDGKDNPITGNCQYGDIVALARVDANTTTSTYKMGGKVTMTQTLVVSNDEKTITVTGTSTDAGGQTVSSVAVYDKQ